MLSNDLVRFRLAGVDTGSSGYSARIMPILGNMVSPPALGDQQQRFGRRACHSGTSCSALGSLVMYVPASIRVTSSRPSGSAIGSTKRAVQGTTDSPRRWPDQKNGGTSLFARRARLANYSHDQNKGAARSLPLTAKSSGAGMPARICL
jgi:hypothetical protein